MPTAIIAIYYNIYISNTSINNNISFEYTGLSNVIDVDAGYNQSLALTGNGEVYVAGWHNYQSETIDLVSYNFTMIDDMSGSEAVYAGFDNSFVIKDNSIYSVGGNQFGKLGLGDNSERHTFAVSYSSEYVAQVPNILDVQAGGSYIITGTNFGVEVGTVMMDGFVFDIKSWESNEGHIHNPPVDMNGILILMNVNNTISNEWYVELKQDAPSDTNVCVKPIATLDRLHELKVIKYEAQFAFAKLSVKEKKLQRKGRKAYTKSIRAEMKLLRAELRALREAGCPPRRHMYWKENGMKLNRFELNWKKRKAIIKKERKEQRELHGK